MNRKFIFSDVSRKIKRNPTIHSTNRFAKKRVNSYVKLPKLVKPEAATRTPTTNLLRPILSNVQTPQSDRNIVLKCTYKSQAGSVRGRPKRYNQDAYLVQPYLQNIKNQYFFVVFDGHGPHGHEVSDLAKRSLQKNIESLLPSPSEPLKPAGMKRAIRLMVKEVEESGINISLSGTTMNAVLIKNSFLICANIGDSRAVLGKKVFNRWEAFALSRDHKPTQLEERVRIINSNGRIGPLQNSQNRQIGPDRVWLKKDSVPGLAMSRSVGDQVAQTVGVISKPEILSTKLSKEDAFVILATDGLWEHVGSQAATEIVGNLLNEGKTEESCGALIEEAINMGATDDITIIVVFLNIDV